MTGLGYNVLEVVDWFYFKNRAMARAKYIAQQGFFPIPKWWYE